MFYWKNDFDYNELDMYEFEQFQSVVTTNQLDDMVIQSLSPFVIPNAVCLVLSKLLYDYCNHKQVNLIDTDRWRDNFLGDVGLYLLEKGRYLQAYFRDVNQNIDKKGTGDTDTTSQGISGTSGTQKAGSVSSNQSANTSGSDTLDSREELGDTLTILDNQTTSTKYLASKNDESYSKGHQQNTTETGFSKTVDNQTNVSMSNDDRLTKDKQVSNVHTSGTYSPLEIAKLESDFKFQPWLDDLLSRLDEHFLVGGLTYA